MGAAAPGVPAGLFSMGVMTTVPFAVNRTYEGRHDIVSWSPVMPPGYAWTAFEGEARFPVAGWFLLTCFIAI